MFRLFNPYLAPERSLYHDWRSGPKTPFSLEGSLPAQQPSMKGNRMHRTYNTKGPYTHTNTHRCWNIVCVLLLLLKAFII